MRRELLNALLNGEYPLRAILSSKSIFISEGFVSHFMVLCLNERHVLNKWQQQVTCEVCMYNFVIGVNFCGENFDGNYFLRELYFCGSSKKPQKLQN